MRRRFFWHRAVRYFLLMLVPTLLMCAVSMVSTLRAGQQMLRHDGQMTLESVREHVSVTLDSVVDQNDLLTSTTRVLLSLRRMLFSYGMSYTDASIFATIRATLNSLVGSNAALDSIYYWLEGAPRVLTSSDNGMLMLETMPNREWLEVYQAMPAEERIRLIRSADGNTIMLIKRMLVADGCVVVNLSCSRLEKNLRPLLHRQEETLYLLNDQGEVLLHVTDATRGVAPDLALLSASEPPRSGEWVRLGGEYHLYDRLQVGPLTAVTLVPMRALFLRMREMTGSMVTVLIIDLFVVLILSWAATRRITAQMYRMIDMFDQALHGLPVEKPAEESHDEYALIMNNIAYMYLRDTAMQNQIREERLRKENAQLMALQLQINPHFLYNTLQTLDYAILSSNVDRQDISDVLHDLSAILRYALSSPQEAVTLGEELAMLRSYVDIQRYRFGSKLVMYIEVDDGLLNARVFRMMLQPLVENSMLHGLNELKERGHIWVRAAREGDRLRVSVTDSGVGMTPEEARSLLERINNPEARSIGLTNLNQRLILSYGEACALQITSEPYVETTVSFSIPYTEA